jgi:hypothetical protein
MPRHSRLVGRAPWAPAERLDSRRLLLGQQPSDLDLLLLQRPPDGALHVLIIDMKFSVEVKVEHRVQVAFCRLTLGRPFQIEAGVHEPVQIGILFRPPADATPEEEIEIQTSRDAAL